ncbi:MAG: acetyl-CoA carboxylase carboxyltransferase subunit alpha [Saprospiraceae bacterium]|jgi:acetyl-CoA carboxylase carboxyl transferase subunit alpha|uniref:acetyl-CoA carboxylase carboxyltransferase subunit alpha n=1 Tax=Candidatus Brachybacter algidus TaxID=2982024 RepID=UPI001B41DA82|nr:acetyl-CoA carboxylase carboxyltransferase subunit alpha [Candidatus Brachybacter algidus]MBP7307032.1 acetyl-CoA carboxylase carboxyltransferase subunit alpha [Saprospiraceae bacterium]MBK7604535.1 acetyl-CoA carboxylase carboxyltransferase subunit alpha [Candidatus Brachybacter algidus]MBK8355290.1 acetyl-CoA carboxylase carboxyltransferase subunit alpha [Candidatus Brachybacter algidus]MBK8604001.1 acetyl-CoA carboxylase carboxyltransferase subunit alpha [Candidatus Brachybacter algidus]
MVFLEFEKPIADLYDQLNKLKAMDSEGTVDLDATVAALEKRIETEREDLYKNLTSWQRVQLSRHPERPYTLDYVKRIFTDFIELHGDRNVHDDKAIVGGMGKLDGKPVMVIGHQKGHNTKERQFRNFGMANPEGYRKALRLMRLAEKFNIPVVCLIDTPGAYPGLEAEDRGQAEAIARNIFEMSKLKTNILCYIIGEGASGGALGIGVGDRVFMLENTWYTVISPENCSTILWHSWDYKIKAADELKLTPEHMFNFKLVDGIVMEPMGGAHADHDEMAEILKKHIATNLKELAKEGQKNMIKRRITKYRNMGKFKVKDS